MSYSLQWLLNIVKFQNQRSKYNSSPNNSSGIGRRRACQTEEKLISDSNVEVSCVLTLTSYRKPDTSVLLFGSCLLRITKQQEQTKCRNVL